VLIVESGRGPIILAGGVDGLGVAEAAHVLLHRLRGKGLAAAPEEGLLRLRGEQPLRQVVRLGKEESVPVTEAERQVGSGEGSHVGRMSRTASFVTTPGWSRAMR
jgi:hypothetical protein